MGLIIKEKKHFVTRFPFWLVVIIFIALSPTLIGFFGAWLTELSTNKPCHEGNCVWMVLPWLTIITAPIGGIALIIYLIIAIIDTIILLRGNNSEAN